MHEETRIFIARDALPAGRCFDVTDADTVELDAEVVELDASFELSAPFAITARFRHDDPLELEPYLWRSAGLEILSEADPVYWSGAIESIRYRHPRGQAPFYEAVLRPALHRLSYGRDTRIFQNQSLPEIVGAVVGGAGQEVVWHLSTPYSPRDYVVQREESDLAFVSRLLADEGIAYWFVHTADAHVMHLADGRDAYVARPAPLSAGFDRGADRNGLSHVELTTRIVHDLHTTRDWSWQRPSAPLEAEHADGPARRFERYEYPGRFDSEADARRLARRRQEAHSCRRWELSARASDPHLRPACIFTLVDARPDELNVDYLITAVTHRLRAAPDAVDFESRSSVYIRAGLASEVFRPDRDVPRPAVTGRESAFVAGPPGEEIHVDPFGRVKTAFYWDRLGRGDHTASTWVRAVQPNMVGSQLLPRVGWEVAVAHLDGDPDRPLVTHKLFNEQEPPTYPLPGSLSRTSWQTASSPGGAGSNELRFDDTLGAMELYLHAERAMHTVVGNDRVATVGVNSRERVHGALNTSVGGSEAVTVGVDESVEVRDDVRLTTGGSKDVTVAQLDAWNVRRNHTITVGGDRELVVVGPMVVVARAVTETLRGDRERTIGGALVRRVGGTFVEAVGGNKQVTVGGAHVLLVRRTWSEQIDGSKTLTAGAATMRSTGPVSFAGGSLDFSVDGSLSEQAVGAFGVSGRAVVVRGDDELRAAAGGSELVLGGDVLDIDATAFSGTAARVRLQGQVEVISADGASDAPPEEPSPNDDWVEVTLVDANGEPRANEAYVLKLADGSERRGTLDGSGHAREDGLPPGTVLISFPDLEPNADADDDRATEERAERSEPDDAPEGDWGGR